MDKVYIMLQGNLTQQSTMSSLTIVEFSRSQFAAIFIATIVDFPPTQSDFPEKSERKTIMQTNVLQ